MHATETGRGSILAAVDVQGALAGTPARTRHPQPANTGARARSPHPSLPHSIDRSLRRTDTWAAKALARLSPHTGADYTASGKKRALDLAVGLSAAVVVILTVGLLLVVNKLLYPRHAALFLQDRVGPDGKPLRVMKIRSMVPRDADDGRHIPACTTFGRFMRRHYLDELPQVLQVVTGRLSLVGTRVLPISVYEGLAASWSRDRFERWKAMYASTPLGLTGPHQILRRAGKEDARRYHRDMFYARHASLGFDLYLLWRTLSARDNEHRVARRSPVLLFGCAMALVPWTIYLGLSLPSIDGDHHIKLFWVALDSVLIAGLASTAWLTLRRRRGAQIVAVATAAVLVLDAVLDTASAPPGWSLVMAVARALVLEIPTAVLVLSAARHAIRTGTYPRGTPSSTPQ